jgi:transcriptional regulator with XRE-family HTH domain
MPHVFHTDPYKHLVELLIAARKDAGLNQAELGKLMGRGQTFVSKVEQGERRLDMVEVIIWCRLVRADVHKVVRKLQAITTEHRI